MKYIVFVFAIISIPSSHGLLLDTVLKLGSAINDAIKASTENVVEQVQPILDQVTDNAKEVLSNANTLVDAVLDTVLSTLEDLNSEAEELGLDVSKCIVDETIDNVRKLAGPAIEKQIDCAKKILGDSKGVLKIVTSLATSLSDQANAIVADALKCPPGLIGEITCVTSLIGKASALLISAPLQIAKKLPELTKSAHDLNVAFNSCTLKVINDVTKQGAETIKDAIACVTAVIKGA